MSEAAPRFGVVVEGKTDYYILKSLVAALSGQDPVVSMIQPETSLTFQELGEGNRVALVREASVKCPFPKRMQGRTGVVIGKRGRAYVVLVNDLNKEKTFVITPIHLKKISSP